MVVVVTAVTQTPIGGGKVVVKSPGLASRCGRYGMPARSSIKPPPPGLLCECPPHRSVLLVRTFLR